MKWATEPSRLKKIFSLRLRRPLRLFLKCDIVKIVTSVVMQKTEATPEFSLHPGQKFRILLFNF
ncbi:MAG: hypothetical protein D6748_09215 [Calditrichaeota bacterium]|nr:MAG: hypothetical protein D6748_09215 [Calditrichota bacterium]